MPTTVGATGVRGLKGSNAGRKGDSILRLHLRKPLRLMANRIKTTQPTTKTEKEMGTSSGCEGYHFTLR